MNFNTKMLMSTLENKFPPMSKLPLGTALPPRTTAHMETDTEQGFPVNPVPGMGLWVSSHFLLRIYNV